MHSTAIISDIHGNILALQAVSEDIQKRNIDKVINLGDHVSGPLWPKETIHFLMSTNWIHILGNHDRQLTMDEPATHGASDSFAFSCLDLYELNWISKLPSLTTIDNEIMAFHGSPNSDLIYLLETIENKRTHLSSREEIIGKLNGTEYPIVVCGHSHKPRCIRITNDILIINPGSIGLQGYIDTSNNPHVVDIGSPHARYAILHKDNDKIDVEFRSITYDWEKAAEKSEQAKRDDWTYALKTGFCQ
jgi:predicted phosphodiesterase